jgi:RNA polymerase sigma factor (sigma-70 family)
MGGKQRHSGIDPDVNRIIAFKARRMARQPEFQDQEIADLQQTLRRAWLQAEKSFDPADGSLTLFADVVLNNCIRKLREAQRAEKRAWWLCRDSLDDAVDARDEAGLSRHDVYDRNAYFQRMGVSDWSQEILDDFNRRLNAALDALTPQQREYVLRLMSESVTAIAEAMGVNRSTLYEWRRRVQREFRKVGLDDFLKRLG